MSALAPLLARFAAPVYPQLGAGERTITDVRLGADTAVLTDRRVVVTGHNFEQSLPLAHISLVRVRFEYIVSNGRLLGFDVGDWMLLMGGCLVSGLLAFLM